MEAPLLILEDALARVEQADFCGVPGYLVVRLKTGARSLGELPPAAAAELGRLLARTVGAVEMVTGADRVYLLSFCEIDRNLHFHLLPRTEQLLVAYHQGTGTAGRAVNGPLLFEWARDTYGPGSPPPAGGLAVGEVCRRLRAELRTRS